jgi:hypothetical protein
MEAGSETRVSGRGRLFRAGDFLQDSLIGAVSGLLVWAVYFVAAYVFLSIACASGLNRIRLLGVDAAQLTLVLMTLVALALIAWIAVANVRAGRRTRTRAGAEPRVAERRRFMSRTAVLLAGLSFVATLWMGGSIVVLAPCV